MSEQNRPEKTFEELKRSEQLFRTVFDNAFEFIGLLAPDGTVLEANRTVLEFIGARRAEVIGKPFWEIPWWQGSPELQHRLKNGVAEAAAGKLVRFEAEHIGVDGAVETIDFSLRPIKNEAGHVTLLIPEGRRITERRRVEQALQRSEELLRGVINALSAHIAVLDGEGCIIAVNNAWERFAAANQAQHTSFVGVNYLAVCRQAATSDVSALEILKGIEEVQKGLRSFFEAEYPCHSATEQRWFLVRVTPLVRRVGGLVVAHESITERKQAEEALKQADRRKDKFIATLSHELRNPLAPIRNVVNLLAKKRGLDADVERGRAIIGRQVDHLSHLIDDLLDVSRITRDKLELKKQSVALADIVSAAVEASRAIIDRGGHRLSITMPAEPVYLDGDAVRLVQVLTNLLTNAAKYTPVGGRIALAAENGDGEVTLRVSDNGIGIAADQLARLFDMFYQANRTFDQTHGGLGIGLTLVQRLVQMHGGTVEVRSPGPNQGSEFLVRLPTLPEGLRAQSLGMAEPAPAIGARRILVADDYGDSAETLAQLLEIEGNQVRVAHDGIEALAVADEFRPAIALLDIGMPKLDGYETARKIREQPWGREIRLIAVTGWGDEDSRVRLKQAGFDGHILKPIAYRDLIKQLKAFDAAGKS